MPRFDCWVSKGHRPQSFPCGRLRRQGLREVVTSGEYIPRVGLIPSLGKKKKRPETNLESSFYYAGYSKRLGGSNGDFLNQTMLAPDCRLSALITMGKEFLLLISRTFTTIHYSSPKQREDSNAILFSFLHTGDPSESTDQ